MAAAPRLQPSTREEEAYWAAGVRYVAGVDEVGRGPLAGPVYAAAVILRPEMKASWLAELRDSKVLPAADRERLAVYIRHESLAFGLGWASVAEIDAWGITAANKAAMRRAIDSLKTRPDAILIDGPATIGHVLPQRAIVDGDALCMSIAAASIVAKVARDAVMCDVGAVYPEYGFESHKGYATPEHLNRLARFGPCLQHRRSWKSVQLRSAAALIALDGAAASKEEQDDAAFS